MAMKYCPESSLTLDLSKLTQKCEEEGGMSQNNSNARSSSSFAMDDMSLWKSGSCHSLFYHYFPQFVHKETSTVDDSCFNDQDRLDEKENSRCQHKSVQGLDFDRRGFCSLSFSSPRPPMPAYKRELSWQQKMAPFIATNANVSMDLQKMRRALDVPVTSLQRTKQKCEVFPNIWRPIVKLREKEERRSKLDSIPTPKSDDDDDDDDVALGKSGKDSNLSLLKSNSESKGEETASKMFEKQLSKSVFKILEDTQTSVPSKSQPQSSGDPLPEPPKTPSKSKKRRPGKSLSCAYKWNDRCHGQMSEILYPPYLPNHSLKSVSLPAFLPPETRVNVVCPQPSSARSYGARVRPTMLKSSQCDLIQNVVLTSAVGPHLLEKGLLTGKVRNKWSSYKVCSEETIAKDVAWECQVKGYEILRKLWRGKPRLYSQIHLATNHQNLQFSPVEITAIKQPYAHFTSSVLTLMGSRSRRRYAHNWVETLPPHSNLLMLLHRFCTCNWLYHVTEHCPWPSLTHLIYTSANGWADNGPHGLEEDACRTIFRQICRGMEHLHSHSVLHGDLNCCNVLVTNNLEVKLTGYGPCCQRMMTTLETITGHLKVQGDTYDIYAPPEIMSRRDTWTKSCDIWCMGIILLQMALGEIPPEVNAAVRLSGSVKNIERFGFANCGYQLSRLIDKILQPRPTSRPNIWTISQHTWLSDGTDLLLFLSEEARKRGVKRTDGSTFPLPKRVQARENPTPDAFYASGSEETPEEDRNNHGGYSLSTSSSSQHCHSKKKTDDVTPLVEVQGQGKKKEQRNTEETKGIERRQQEVNVLETGKNELRPSQQEGKGDNDTRHMSYQSTKSRSCLLLKLVESMVSEDVQQRNDEAELALMRGEWNLFRSRDARTSSPREKRLFMSGATRRASRTALQPVLKDRPPTMDTFKDLLIIGKSTDCGTHIAADTLQSTSALASAANADAMETRIQSLKALNMNVDTAHLFSNRCGALIDELGKSSILLNKSGQSLGTGGNRDFYLKTNSACSQVSTTLKHGGGGNMPNRLGEKRDRFHSPRFSQESSPQVSRRMYRRVQENGPDSSPLYDYFRETSYSEADYSRRQHFLEDEEQAMQEIESIIAREEGLNPENRSFYNG